MCIRHRVRNYSEWIGKPGSQENLDRNPNGKFLLVSWLPDLFRALTSCFPAFLIKFGGRARVVEWQTRTFEGRMPQGVGVQVPPRAPMKIRDSRAVGGGASFPIRPVADWKLAPTQRRQ